MTEREELVELLSSVPDLTTSKFYPIGSDGEPEPYPAIAMHTQDEVAARAADALLAAGYRKVDNVG